ncbi:MAG TPA: hypothetical protein PLF50_04055 [Candidatus Cloacimonadota bacterium]|nr:hypothetical protein [Candidatus Cloacimonadota bacterium]
MKAKYLIFSLLILCLMFCGCEIKNFNLPSWNVNLKVPLINEHYYVSDLVDSVNFFMENDSIIVQASGDFEANPLNNIPVVLLDEPEDATLLSGIEATGSFSLSQAQDSIRLSYGIISQGEIDFNFSNMAPEVTSASLVFQEFRDNTGAPLTISYNNMTGWRSVNLEGYFFGQEGSDNVINQLDYDLHVTSSLPIGTPVGNLEIRMDGPVYFSLIRGIVTSYKILMNNSLANVDVEYPEGVSDAIQIKSAKITIDVHNPYSFACLMNGQIYGRNDDGEEAVYNIPQSEAYLIHPVNDASGGFTRLIFEGTEVNNLVQIMPTHVELREAFFSVYNPNHQIGEMNIHELLNGTYIVRTPLVLEFTDKEIMPADSTEIEISDDNIDLIEENINDVHLMMSIVNRLPIGGQITLFFSTDPNFRPDVNDPSQLVKSAHLSALTYQEQEIDLNLDKNEIKMFTHPFVYMRLKIKFDNTNGPVSITATPEDYIGIRCMLQVNAHIEES